MNLFGLPSCYLSVGSIGCSILDDPVCHSRPQRHHMQLPANIVSVTDQIPRKLLVVAVIPIEYYGMHPSRLNLEHKYTTVGRADHV